MSNLSVTGIMNMPDGVKAFKINPSAKFVLVEVADENTQEIIQDVLQTAYVVGSSGKVKKIVEYSDSEGLKATATTFFYYQNAGFPTTVTFTKVLQGEV